MGVERLNNVGRGARFQAIFQRNAWILDGTSGNQIVLWANIDGDWKAIDEIAEKEETDKRPFEEGICGNPNWKISGYLG